MKTFFITLFATLVLSTSSLATTPTATKTSVVENKEKIELAEAQTAKIEKECSIKIEGTVNGQEVNIDVTFEANNCFVAYAQILSGLFAKDDE